MWYTISQQVRPTVHTGRHLRDPYFQMENNVPLLNVCNKKKSSKYKINSKRGKIHFIDRRPSGGNGEVEQECKKEMVKLFE